MGKLTIISHDDNVFRDRIEAGRVLAVQLEKMKLEEPVVVGILRGGLIVAREIARVLDTELDIVISRKLGAPFNAEMAIGSISEDGKLFINKEIASLAGAGETYVEEEKERQLKEIEKRIKRYRSILPKVPLKGKEIIVTDDGVATGATMQASIWSIRQEEPKKIVVALPVGPEDSIKELARDADELICMRVPVFFAAVGQFYRDFDQTSDEEILSILREESISKLNHEYR